MTETEFAFVARYANQRIKGHTFRAVGDALQERGFVMAAARQLTDGVVEVPHRDQRRRPAVLERRNGHVVNTAPPTTTVDVAAAELADEAVRAGAAQPVGLQTRECGAVHSDGVVCFIAVLFEALPCGCGDRTYEHDGPHEAVDADGVRYRWTEVLIIQDEPYNCYGPLEVD